MKKQTLALLALSSFLAFGPALRAADEATIAAKKIFAEKQDSVVWVSAVAKVSFSADGAKDLPVNLPDQEQKVEALATIIDSSGLLVAALSQVDPARNVTGREFRMGGSTVKIEAAATLKEFKVVMPDGAEIPAEIVMKDADLDLAFIRIKTTSKEAKGVTFKALDLKDGAPGNVAEDVITLWRMDEVLNRVPSVARGQVTAVTKKPREFLRATGATQGCPTFAVNGKLVGIGVTRSIKTKPPQVVIMPAADVLEIAEQAKTAKPVEPKEKPAEEKKAEKAKEEK